MDVRASELLRQLGAGIRPDGGASAPSSSPIESRGFAELLSQASEGRFASASPVELPPGAGVDLTGEQLARLGPLTDAAAAQGSQRLLAMIDGQTVAIDAVARRVMGPAQINEGGVMTGFDAFVVAPPAGADATGGGAAPGVAGDQAAGPTGVLGRVVNESVAELLARLTKDDGDGEPGRAA